MYLHATLHTQLLLCNCIIIYAALTDAERKKEDDELMKAGLKKDPNAKKKKIGFMQKYYHKGAFYMDDESIRDKNDVRLKDYNEPTLEDHFDKKALPKIMQVKNFGKIGRTKCVFILCILILIFVLFLSDYY